MRRAVRCAGCGFTSERQSFFRLEKCGLTNRERTHCAGCRPATLSRGDRAAVAIWVIFLLMGLMMARDSQSIAEVAASGGGMLLVLTLSAPLNIFIHEMGHAGAAWAMGFGVRRIEIGRGAPVLRLRLGEALLLVRRYAFVSGVTYARQAGTSRLGNGVFILGGVTANLMVAALLVLVYEPLKAMVGGDAQDAVRTVTMGLILSNAWVAFMNLLPDRQDGLHSDGAQLIDLFKAPVASLESIEVPGLPAWRVKALIYEMLRRHAEALAVYEAQFKASPRSPHLLNMIMHLTLHLHGGDAAIRRHEQAMRDLDGMEWEPDSEQSQAWLDANLAWAMLHALGGADLVEVDRVLSRAEAFDPDPIEFRATRAALDLRRGDLAAEEVLIGALQGAESAVDRAAFGRFLAREADRRGDPAARQYRRLSLRLDEAVTDFWHPTLELVP